MGLVSSVYVAILQVIFNHPGDSHMSPGMLEFISLVRKIYPGIFIHSIYVDKDLDKDQKAGWVGLMHFMSISILAN